MLELEIRISGLRDKAYKKYIAARPMNPLEPESFNHKYAWINGIRYHYVDEGQGPILLLVHGFPDLWYGWRYQIPHLVSLGYRVIAPDIRGYGETDGPLANESNIRDYGMKNICKDLVELLDLVGGQGTAATLIGHDWGGMMVWRMCLHYPDRVKAVAAICTSFAAPTKAYISPEQLVERWPQFEYQLWFQKSTTDSELDSNPKAVLKSIYRGRDEHLDFLQKCTIEGLRNAPDIPPTKQLRLTEKELEYYAKNYDRRSFHGALNNYRTRRVNWEDERDCPTVVNHKALLVLATHDLALPPAMAKSMRDKVPNAVYKEVAAGHWVQMEQPEQLNQILTDWLQSVRNVPAPSL
ncbi:soluble epoxide hydrolase in complex with A synthetic inhibitor [Phlyctochytrium arcticum]|nr:soluble epoxide hydrolase in complex with A synthetic inhibitor [Phlyctochytrium arcticum]KAI9098061.1 soluble epoxide hydrolase in complex with A synthetic inhibitor [Phlyctochytrium arcticum]